MAKQLNKGKVKFTEKQSIFIDHYLMSYNATQAALAAGYSEKTAYSQGSFVLKNPEVQREIEKRKKRIIERMEITREGIIRELQLLNSTALSEGNLRIALDAIREINKVLGIYEAKKIDITSNGNTLPTINYVIPKDGD